MQHVLVCQQQQPQMAFASTYQLLNDCNLGRSLSQCCHNESQSHRHLPRCILGAVAKMLLTMQQQHLLQKQLLSLSLCGFTKQRSKELALVDTADALKQKMDNKFWILGIPVYLTKAFNHTDQTILISSTTMMCVAPTTISHKLFE